MAHNVLTSDLWSSVKYLRKTLKTSPGIKQTILQGLPIDSSMNDSECLSYWNINLAVRSLEQAHSHRWAKVNMHRVSCFTFQYSHSERHQYKERRISLSFDTFGIVSSHSKLCQCKHEQLLKGRYV